MELHYGDRSTISFTSSLGARVSTSYGYDWGTLQPSARLAAVHEFQNKSRQLTNELVSTPGTGFQVTTDSPDRNYLNLGLGVSAALNGGTQLFLDYEKRTQDKLLSSWAINLGALMEF
jgi:outer membrane autotransporter protein